MLEENILETLDTIPEEFDFKNATLEEVKKWIPKDLVKGGLHRMLGIPIGQKIPIDRLHAAAKKGGLIGQRARFALNARGFKKAKSKETLTPEDILEIVLATAPDPPEEQQTLEQKAAAAGVTVEAVTSVNAAGIATAGKQALALTTEQIIAQNKAASIRNDERIREEAEKTKKGLNELIKKAEEEIGKLREELSKANAAALSKADLEAHKTKLDFEFGGKLAESTKKLLELINTIEKNFMETLESVKKKFEELAGENKTLKETVEQDKQNIVQLTETVQTVVKQSKDFIGELGEMRTGFVKVAETLVDRQVLSEVPFKGGSMQEVTETVTTQPGEVEPWVLDQFKAKVHKRK